MFFSLTFITSLAADGGHLTTRRCAVGETTNTNLTTIWGNLWFFQVPFLIYTDRLNHVRTLKYLTSSSLLNAVFLQHVTNKSNINFLKGPGQWLCKFKPPLITHFIGNSVNT